MNDAALSSWENLWRAYQNAARGKRGRPVVAQFEHRLIENLLALQEALTTRTYRPGPYHSFYVHEPKRRLISAAPFPDRVVHHALCNIIQPSLERSFIHTTFANRVGKGTHSALNMAQRYARRFPYVLACDVRQFFPSIDHAILRRLLFRSVKASAVRWLVNMVLHSGEGVLDERYDMVFFPGDTPSARFRPRGLPIGNLTSQIWANAYLNPIDQHIKRELRCPGYVRYVDDLLLFGPNKSTLWIWLKALETRLATFRLTLHPGAHPRPVTEGIPFLGFVVFPERRRLKRRKGVHFRRKLKRIQQGCDAGQIAPEHLQSVVQGWVNHTRYGNTVGLRKAVFNDVLGGKKPA